ncbi:hypothetical protein MASR1M31_19600 [Porphyromonadaceae bacterium]
MPSAKAFNIYKASKCPQAKIKALNIKAMPIPKGTKRCKTIPLKKTSSTTGENNTDMKNAFHREIPSK